MSRMKFASLTAGLLARKGEAHPAATSFGPAAFAPPAGLTRGSFGPVSGHPAEAPPPDAPRASGEAAAAQPWPAGPAHGSAAAAPSSACAGACADAPPARRYSVSVRLHRGRYLRLKLASAHLRRPSQDIVADALDLYFAQLGAEAPAPCPCLAVESA